MQTIKPALLLLLCCFLFLHSATAQPKAIKKMKALMRLEETYWSNGDIDGYVSLYAPSDSARMILGKGAAYGRTNILAFYKKYWPKEKMGKLVLDGEQFEKISHKFYFVTGYFHVLYPDGKKIEGRYSSLMKKIKGKWYIYTDHSA